MSFFARACVWVGYELTIAHGGLKNKVTGALRSMFIVSVKLACNNCDEVVCPRTPLRAGPFIRPMHREAEKRNQFYSVCLF